MTRLLAFLLLCACGCAATNVRGTVAGSRLPEAAVGASTATTGVLAAPAATAAAPLSVSFRMPIYHDLAPLSGLPDTTSLLPTGYHRWEIGYSSYSKACRDSGLAWCRDIRNFGAWRPGAQIVPFRSGYAAPGQYITVDSILVSSFSWPYALWGRAWTDVPGRWTYITERFSN